MQKQYANTVKLPRKEQQRQLHRALGEYDHWLKRRKDAGEIRKDKRQSLPPAMLPMPF